MKNELDYWRPSLKLLGDTDFLKIMVEYDKDNVDRKAVLKAKKIMSTLPISKLEAASKAAAGMGMWVNAICLYSDSLMNQSPEAMAIRRRIKEIDAEIAMVQAPKPKRRKLSSFKLPKKELPKPEFVVQENAEMTGTLKRVAQIWRDQV